MRPSLRRGFLLLLTALSFLIVAPVYAVPLYDVIQLAKKGYRDNQIIGIIETTDSRFQVDTETILTLKREGVSEAVIQAIVARSDGPPDASRDTVREEPRAAQPSSRDDGWRTRGDRAPATQAEPPHEHDDAAKTNDEHEVDVVAPRPAPAAHAHAASSATSFSYFPFEESGAGHHQHIALALGDVPIIVLRSEGGYASIEQRAHSAADALNRAVSEGLSLAASTDGVIALTPSGARLPVLRVARGDVVALQRRSIGAAAPARIASYWAALLGDYVDLAAGREPTHLALSGIGSIRSLYRELAAAPASNDGAQAEASTSLAAAVDRMSPEDRQALIDLAGQIPARFRIQER